MVQEAVDFDFSAGRGFAFKNPEDKKPCEEWNQPSTSKLKAVIATARTAYKWQSTKAGQPFQETSFKIWLDARHVALRPIYWEISSDAYSCWKKDYEALQGKEIFGVRRYVEDDS